MKLLISKRAAKSFYFACIFGVLLFSCSLYLVSCSSEKKASASERKYLTPDALCGTVTFSNGCSPKLDTLIKFGIALIHHMTYEDAEYTFNKVIQNDSGCFWGYWGKAMTFVHPLWPDVPDENHLKAGYVISQNALKLAKTEKEKLYGSAIAAFYKEGLYKTQQERLAAFNDGWQAASRELPEDIEARMFSVLSSLAVVSSNDKSYKRQREAGAIAEKVLETIPDHPGAIHYAIHAYDYPPLAKDAIRLAREYYKIAPEIPHALHMPTHIFTRMGYWQESIDLNFRAAEAAKKMPVNGKISAQYFHALDYLAYAYLQQSEYKKVKDIAISIDNLSQGFQETPVTAYALAAIPSRLALEYQDWTGAANLSLNHPDFPWNKFPQYEALIYFAKGIGAARSGNAESAEKSLRKLEELQNTFPKTEANKYLINQIEIQKTVVKAWQLFAQNDNDKALRIMTIAANTEDASEKLPVTPGQLLPAREMLGDLLLELGRPKEALKEYENSLQNNPNRFNTLFGAGKAAELSGNSEKARFYFSELLKSNKSPVKERKRLEYAQKAVSGNGDNVQEKASVKKSAAAY